MKKMNDEEKMYIKVMERVNENVKCKRKLSIRKKVFLYKMKC
jgi:hypothetical protein